MKNNMKVLAMLLALVTVISVFAACGDVAETTLVSDETEPSNVDTTEIVPEVTEPTETEPVETEAPETEAPETDAPETEAPQPEAPAEVSGLNIVDGVFKSVKFDFESDMSVVDYFESIGDFSTHQNFSKGEIKDGKWRYNGKDCIAFNDAYNVYDCDKFSIEFDFCFDAYINVDKVTSVFTIIADDGGSIDGNSKFYMALRMSPDGKMYHEAAKGKSFLPELGRTYNYKIEIDRTTSSAIVYIDGEVLCTPDFTASTLPLKYFRFLDANRGADVWFDNIIITALSDTKVSEDTPTETPAGDTSSDSSFTEVKFDFETELLPSKYFSSIEGFSVNKSFKEGSIENGKWVYVGNGTAIEDNLGIYKLDKFSIEFDFCFDKYITTENAASVFTIINDNTSSISGASKFYFVFRMLSDGTVYHDHAKQNTFKVELGKTHHYKIEIDRTNGKAHVYFDGNLLVSPNFTPVDLPYCCFRIMDNNKGAEMWIDNLVIKNLS